MIVGFWHPGSGIGDQAFSYLATRTTAERLGVDFGMIGDFKGDGFIALDRGKLVGLKNYVEANTGKIIVESDLPLYESKLPYLDPEFFFIKDNTIVDGCTLQDERYWDINKAREWLKVEPLDMPDDLCVINFRGGEYATVPELFLPKEYWESAMDKVANTDYLVDFQVETDDTHLASKFFPEFPIRRDIGLNWRSVRYAKHLILSNSAFGILPALLNENVKEVIAPFGWNARNKSLTKWEGRPMNYYRKFTYI